jgi:hypothetical protein
MLLAFGNDGGGPERGKGGMLAARGLAGGTGNGAPRGGGIGSAADAERAGVCGAGRRPGCGRPAGPPGSLLADGIGGGAAPRSGC